MELTFPLYDYDFRLRLQPLVCNDQLRHHRTWHDPLHRVSSVRVDLTRPQRRHLVLFLHIDGARDRAAAYDEKCDDDPRRKGAETPDPGVDRRLVATGDLGRDLVRLIDESRFGNVILRG